jgi:pimeloyl-ACP methyl ester carboxylesterase
VTRGRRLLLSLAATGLGAATAAVTAGVIVERRVVRLRRESGDEVDLLSSLHSAPRKVRTDDGIDLHTEVDEAAPYPGDQPARRRSLIARKIRETEPTLLFVHGYALNLDCWHFQRECFRGKYRMVFYDQRSHGRSDRAPKGHATIDRLGSDVATVLESLVPEGPVVLVGHSMGGMSIIAFAEQHPELFADRVAGVGLISTTAGGMRTHRIISPLVPDAVAGQVTPRLLAGLARAPELVDGARRRGSNVGFLMTERFAFGDDVPASYIEFVDEMLSQTPFEVLAEFFPNFDTLDKFDVLRALEGIPTTIVCGTKDLLTSIGHSRKMASWLPHAKLVECEGAGHMVIMEQKDKVNAALAELVERALS